MPPPEPLLCQCSRIVGAIGLDEVGGSSVDETNAPAPGGSLGLKRMLRSRIGGLARGPATLDPRPGPGENQPAAIHDPERPGPRPRLEGPGHPAQGEPGFRRESCASCLFALLYPSDASDVPDWVRLGASALFESKTVTVCCLIRILKSELGIFSDLRTVTRPGR